MTLQRAKLPKHVQKNRVVRTKDGIMAESDFDSLWGIPHWAWNLFLFLMAGGIITAIVFIAIRVSERFDNQCKSAQTETVGDYLKFNDRTLKPFNGSTSATSKDVANETACLALCSGETGCIGVNYMFNGDKRCDRFTSGLMPNQHTQRLVVGPTEQKEASFILKGQDYVELSGRLQKSVKA